MTTLSTLFKGDHNPLITLGEKFVPGSDDSHYCKPTSVAVSQDTNSFFVSDGYCNSRIIKYGVTVDRKRAENVIFRKEQFYPKSY